MLAINGGQKSVTVFSEDTWQVVTDDDLIDVAEFLKTQPLSRASGGIVASFEEQFFGFMPKRRVHVLGDTTSVQPFFTSVKQIVH